MAALNFALCALLLAAWLWLVPRAVVLAASLLPIPWQVVLGRPRRWWWPLRVVGWVVAYAVVAVATAVCVLLTVGILLLVVGL